VPNRADGGKWKKPTEEGTKSREKRTAERWKIALGRPSEKLTREWTKARQRLRVESAKPSENGMEEGRKGFE
jgi:hypothetical protein